MNKFFSNIKATVIKGVTDIKEHWNKPHEGEYVSYKEFGLFCIGASGASSLGGSILTYLVFAANCFLVGSIYGLAFKDIYYISLLGIPFSYVFNVVNMLVTDNLGDLPQKTKKTVNCILLPLLVIGFALYFVPQQYTERFIPSLPQLLGNIIVTSILSIYYRIFVYKKLAPRFGKYRPWIIVSIVPLIILLFMLVYVPFESFPYFQRLWTLHLLFSVYNIFSSFPGQMGNIQNVISPSSDERVKIMSIGSIVYSAIPSLINILLPLSAAAVGGFNSLAFYRKVIPIFVVILCVLSMFLFFGVKERVVVAKTHKPKINFWQGSKSVLRNKYFWITNISNMFGGVAAGSIVLAQVLFVYSLRNDALYAVYSTIIGTAYVPGMLMATFCIRRFGKRNLLLFSKIIAIMMGAGQFLSIVISNVWIFIIFSYLSILLTTPSSIATQAMTADIWDYQQWLTGERLDGFSGIFGMIAQPVTLAFGMVVPAVYGIVGLTTDWDILYVKDFRDKIIIYSIIIGSITNLLTAFPYLFYDLSEKKHKGIIEDLKRRASEEDEGVVSEQGSEVAAATESGSIVLADNEAILEPEDSDE